ncbi:hypothetical protein RvVAR0630_pl06670 (plasmid) [Agrobacterium vitis]|nr:hypothetical protein RvVAR0630_pl06670 [Agrobacterium vitis]
MVVFQPGLSYRRKRNFALRIDGGVLQHTIRTGTFLEKPANIALIVKDEELFILGISARGGDVTENILEDRCQQV